MTSSKSKKKDAAPTGVEDIDRLAALPSCTIDDYVRGVSAYIRNQGALAPGPKKASQIRLSNALARALATDLEKELPSLRGRLVTEERRVAGGLRVVNADVSESHPLDGLRLAVELKPINLAVGRALWNRFGDIRTFAVNIHLKFPFAVVGGVLVIPTYEEAGTAAAKKAEQAEQIAEEGAQGGDVEVALGDSSDTLGQDAETKRKSTMHLITRAVDRLVRAGGRLSEAEASHLLEGIAVVVYDPETSAIVPDVPPLASGLRWETFITDLASAYRVRFED